MARFIHLSKFLLNVDAIRFILPGMVKLKEGEVYSCTVYFIHDATPYAFYGDDAHKLINFVTNNPDSSD